MEFYLCNVMNFYLDRLNRMGLKTLYKHDEAFIQKRLSTYCVLNTFMLNINSSRNKDSIQSRVMSIIRQFIILRSYEVNKLIHLQQLPLQSKQDKKYFTLLSPSHKDNDDDIQSKKNIAIPLGYVIKVNKQYCFLPSMILLET